MQRMPRRSACTEEEVVQDLEEIVNLQRKERPALIIGMWHQQWLTVPVLAFHRYLQLAVKLVQNRMSRFNGQKPAPLMGILAKVVLELHETTLPQHAHQSATLPSTT
jgi:Fe-S cluster assembly ATPase SufC